ncbi:branched-chain amino acid ABC transporter permease [Rhodobacteraceae bacterium Araon29]
MLQRLTRQKQRTWKQSDLVIFTLLLAIGLVLPLFIDSRYSMSQLTLFLIWATVVSQWNIVMGFAGIFSLAQLVLFGFGGYTTAMLAKYFGINLFLGTFLGGVATIFVGVLIGAACLRLRGIYVALLTFAIAQAAFSLISSDISCFTGSGQTCKTLTGGQRGLSQFGDYGFRELLGRNYITGNYYVALGALTLATLVSIVVVRGPLGYAFRALRDNESVAVCAGINRFKYQLLVFGISAFVTGIAGGIYAAHFKVIGPSVLGFPLFAFLVSMMIVGGLGNLWGPILGAALLMYADEQLKDFTEYRNMGLGAIIVLFVVLLPDGLAGMVERGWQKYGPILKRTIGSNRGH